MSGTVHLIFPQNEYYINHVSVHEKGKAFNNFNLQSALEPVHILSGVPGRKRTCPSTEMCHLIFQNIEWSPVKFVSSNGV